MIAYNHAWSKREYYLCAGASKLYLNPAGEVDFTGLAAEPMFFAGAFKKYGVEVQVTRVGRYKSAVEPYILDRMSDANREQLTGLLGDIWAEWKGAVATDRKRSPEEIQAIADEQGMLTAAETLKAGLVDQLATPDQVLDELKQLAGAQAQRHRFPAGGHGRLPGPGQPGHQPQPHRPGVRRRRDRGRAGPFRPGGGRTAEPGTAQAAPGPPR